MILLETAIKGSWFRLQDVNKVRGSEMFHQIAEVSHGLGKGADAWFSASGSWAHSLHAQARTTRVDTGSWSLSLHVLPLKSVVG